MISIPTGTNILVTPLFATAGTNILLLLHLGTSSVLPLLQGTIETTRLRSEAHLGKLKTTVLLEVLRLPQLV